MTNSVKVSGIRAAGSTLKASTVDTTLKNVSYTWVSVENGKTNVLSTSASYKLTNADIDSTINVIATKSSGVEIGTLSNVLTTDVSLSMLNQTHTGGISLKGATTVGSVLSVSSTLKDKDGLGTLHYSWLVNGTEVKNTDGTTYTGSTYEIANEGQTVKAVVSYEDKHGFTESASSALSATTSYSTVKSSLKDHLAVTTPNKAVTGGLGADTFIFNSSNLKYKIGDFSTSQGDTLNLSAIDADLTTSNNQAFSNTILSAKPVSGPTAGVLWFNSLTNTLSGSTDSDYDAEFSVVLTGVTSLTAADIVAF